MEKKICHVISSLRMGGAQQLLLRVCESIGKPEFKHAVICLTGETELARELRKNDVKVYCLNMNGILHTIQCIWQLRGILKFEQPHIVHTWLYHADFMTSIAMIGMNTIPLIWSTHHANEKFEGDKKITKWLVKLLALLSSRFPLVIIFCSEYAKKVHHKLGYKPQREVVINNGIDTSRFSPSSLLRTKFREQLGIEEKTMLVGMVARYSPVKGYKVFLDMAHELLESNNDIKFVMIGTNVSHTNKELREAMDRLEITEHSLLLGERSDIETAINGMDVLVCPSFAESFGLVVVEALACGVPVVCSDLEVLRLIVGDEYTAPVGDSHLLAISVYKLLIAEEDERKNIGHKGRERIIQSFNGATMIEKYRNTYYEISGVTQ